jgi:DNA-binding transcriptional regulator GbsR (MarR family)
MDDQEKLNEILELSEKITQRYLDTHKGRHIKVLKDKINDLLTNPIWNDKLLFKLKNKVEELNLSKDESDLVLQELGKKLDDYYNNHIESKPYLFEGRIREYEKKLIEFFVRAGKAKNQNTVLAKIIGCLMLHKRDGLTQNQIQEITGLSKGAISTNLKLIEVSPILKKERIKGTKIFLYSFGGDFSAIAVGTGTYKMEANEHARNFFLTKKMQLSEYKDEKGYNILSERMAGIQHYLEIHKRLLNIILESDYMKKLEKDGV